MSTNPPGGVWPGYSQVDWINQIYPNLSDEDKPIECIQEPGEILYVPEGWYHAVINLGEGVAIGYQMFEHKGEYMKEGYRLRSLVKVMREAFKDKDAAMGETLWQEISGIYNYLQSQTPKNTENLFVYCHTLLAYGKETKNLNYVQSSLDCYQQVLKLDPFFIHAYNNLALVMILEKYPPELILSVLAKGYEKNPRNFYLLQTYSDFLFRNFTTSIGTNLTNKITFKEKNFLLTLLEKMAVLRPDIKGSYDLEERIQKIRLSVEKDKIENRKDENKKDEL